MPKKMTNDTHLHRLIIGKLTSKTLALRSNQIPVELYTITQHIHLLPKPPKVDQNKLGTSSNDPPNKHSLTGPTILGMEPKGNWKISNPKIPHSPYTW